MARWLPRARSGSPAEYHLQSVRFISSGACPAGWLDRGSNDRNDGSSCREDWAVDIDPAWCASIRNTTPRGWHYARNGVNVRAARETFSPGRGETARAKHGRWEAAGGKDPTAGGIKKVVSSRHDSDNPLCADYQVGTISGTWAREQ